MTDPRASIPRESPSARRRRIESEQRKAEFLIKAKTAGHEARVEHIGSVLDVLNQGLARVSCTCGRYRSVTGEHAASWLAWRSHAGAAINAETLRAAS